jgi:prepilin-type N-terminal cleavage/methylation domain-containing protein
MCGALQSRQQFKAAFSRSKAFTLVELLAALAIVAVLAALTASSLATAKFQARNTVCKNNLRQTAVASALYTGAYNNFPPEFVFLGSDGAVYLEWDQFLEKELFPARSIAPLTAWSQKDVFYSRSPVERSFLCPIIAPLWPIDPKRNSLPQAARYGYNAHGIGGAMYDNNYWMGMPFLGLCGLPGGPEMSTPAMSRRPEELVSPCEMIEFGDPFARSLNPERDGAQQWAYWRPRPDVPLEQFPYHFFEKSAAGAKNHRQRFNKIFCDGHLEPENFTRRFNPTDEYLQHWNFDNQPHREAWQ